MRTRKEIERDVRTPNAYQDPTDAILEVLLDIRDMLAKGCDCGRNPHTSY